MDLDQAIKTRRSIRKYLDKAVEFEKLTLLLDAARYAPNSGNLQDFRFIAVNDKDKKNKIAEASLRQYWMNTATLFIVVCSDINRLKTYYKNNSEKYSIQNSAAAAILISLKSVDLGLGTCWVDVFDPKAVSRILRIDEGIQPQIILTIGYPYDKPFKEPLKVSLKRIISFNKYGDKTAEEIGWGQEKPVDKIKNIIKSLFQKIKSNLKNIIKK